MIGVVVVIAVAFFLVIAFMLLKLGHFDRKIKLVLLIFLGVLVYISIVSIFSSEKVDLTSPGGIAKAIYLYFGWLGRTFANLWDVGKQTVHMVGDAIRLNMTG